MEVISIVIMMISLITVVRDIPGGLIISDTLSIFYISVTNVSDTFDGTQFGIYSDDEILQTLF